VAGDAVLPHDGWRRDGDPLPSSRSPASAVARCQDRPAREPADDRGTAFGGGVRVEALHVALNRRDSSAAQRNTNSTADLGARPLQRLPFSAVNERRDLSDAREAARDVVESGGTDCAGCAPSPSRRRGRGDGLLHLFLGRHGDARHKAPSSGDVTVAGCVACWPACP